MSAAANVAQVAEGTQLEVARAAQVAQVEVREVAQVEVAQVAEGTEVTQVEAFVDALAGTPLAGLSRRLTHEVVEMGLESREIDAELKVVRLVRLALKALEEKESKALNLKEAKASLGLAAAVLKGKAAKHPFIFREAKLKLAEALSDLEERTGDVAVMYGLCGVDDAEALADLAHHSDVAESAQAMEAAVRVETKGHLDAVVEGLRGRWGTAAAHDGLVQFLIEGTKSKIASLAETAGVTELGTVRLLKDKTVTLGGSFVVPTRFATNGSVGPNVFLFAKDPVTGEWDAITGSAVSKNDLETVLWYRLVTKAVNERADIKATIQAALLKALCVGASATVSPWRAVISKGSFSVVVLVNKRKHSTVGLAMYQLALVPSAESMSGSSPELAETMGAIKANMTEGQDAAGAPQYFTLRDREPSGRITLAPVPGRKGPFDTRDETDRMETEEAPMVGRMMSAGASKKRGRESTEAE
jgi:hypothetical protein